MSSRGFIVILATLMLVPLWAQYNEKQILVQLANQHMMQRQYTQAEEVFLDILEKYPNDQNAIMQLAYMFLNISADDKAEALLTKYQRHIPEKTFSELRIQVLALQGRIEQANAMADSYLELHGSTQNVYHMVAGYFQRRAAYDSAIRIYELARVKFGEGVFSLEIANAGLQAQRYPLAMREYIRFMTGQSNINQFVKNQVMTIVKADSSLVDLIRQGLPPGNYVMLDLYASALLALNRYAEALEIYKQLPLTYIRDFATEQRNLENFDIARQAFRYLAEASPQPHQKLGYGQEVARIFHNQAEYDSAKVVLDILLQDPYWTQNAHNRRSSLYVGIRKLVAENEMALGTGLDQIRAWLTETKQFSSQLQENQELDLELARLALLNKDYPAADIALSGVTLGKLADYRDYLQFMKHFFQGHSEVADSLMHEYLIRHAASAYANDVIYLNMLGLGMEEMQRQSFAEAVRMLQLFKTEGIELLQELYVQTADEELAILAIEWSLAMGCYSRAEELLRIEFQDELAGEYAQMLSLALMQNRDAEINLAKEFLKTKPNSIFSPGFRQVISRISTNHLNL